MTDPGRVALEGSLVSSRRAAGAVDFAKRSLRFGGCRFNNSWYLCIHPSAAFLRPRASLRFLAFGLLETICHRQACHSRTPGRTTGKAWLMSVCPSTANAPAHSLQKEDEKPQGDQPPAKLTKAQRKAQHAELNRRIWESAYVPSQCTPHTTKR
jgi:hypothetical protein